MLVSCHSLSVVVIFDIRANSFHCPCLQDLTVSLLFVSYRFGRCTNCIGLEDFFAPITKLITKYSPHARPIPDHPGQTTFAFQWSIPNAIPSSPPAILEMWNALKLYDFHTILGEFVGTDIPNKDLKRRFYETMHRSKWGEAANLSRKFSKRLSN